MPGLTPPATPSLTTPAAGTWASGSPHAQTSGTFVDYAEYTQWMTLEYTRNPWYGWSNADNEFRNLTTASSVDVIDISQHNLHFNITVHNSCKIIHGNFTLSSSYQPQKLTLLANKFDKAGYSYGEVDGASSLHVFGPQGSILTTQPMIRRDIKTSADVAYSLTQVGTSHALQASGYPDPYAWEQGDDIGQTYDYYLRPDADHKGGTSFPRATSQNGGDTFNMYGGGYAVSSEPGFEDNAAGMTRLIAFIEKNCSMLDEAIYQYRFPIPIPVVSEGYGSIQEGDRLVVNPYYNTSHHDYT